MLDNGWAGRDQLVHLLLLVHTTESHASSSCEIIGRVCGWGILVLEHVNPSMHILGYLTREESAWLLPRAHHGERNVAVLHRVFLLHLLELFFELAAFFYYRLPPPGNLAAIVEGIIGTAVHVLTDSAVDAVACEQCQSPHFFTCTEHDLDEARFVLVRGHCNAAVERATVHDFSVLVLQPQLLEQGMLQVGAISKSEVPTPDFQFHILQSVRIKLLAACVEHIHVFVGAHSSVDALRAHLELFLKDIDRNRSHVDS
mmetsp:Transcript_30906/g.73655  ORF Transcript_30906/g.73655 Transcript_30906/m.73655 type:complete len:257 (-) Transcript_30906:370-1140(-)